jgi:preprotein translocase subunit SecG
MGPKDIRTALAVIAILAGIIVALVTGILVRSGGGNVTSAALSGGGTFAATVALVLTITKFLDLVP